MSEKIVYVPKRSCCSCQYFADSLKKGGSFNCVSCFGFNPEEGITYKNYKKRGEKKMASDYCITCSEEISDSGQQYCPKCMAKAKDPDYGRPKNLCVVCKKDLTGTGRKAVCVDCSKKKLIRVGPEEFVEESCAVPERICVHATDCSRNRDRCLICGKEISGTGQYTICSSCTNKALKNPGPVGYAEGLCTGPEEYLVGLDVSTNNDGTGYYPLSCPAKLLTIEDYQDDAARTIDQHLTSLQQLQEGVMGACGEAGEASELVKKHIFQGHQLDTFILAKELGDALWYLTEAASAIGYTLEEIMRLNIEKRSERYPDGFKSELSIERKPEDI